MAATEKWVVNASPLICLGKLGHLDWLGRLAAEFVVPAGVATEIESGPPDDPARQWLQTVGSAYVRRGRENLLSSLASALDDASKSGLYVSPAVRREALRLVGE